MSSFHCGSGGGDSRRSSSSSSSMHLSIQNECKLRLVPSFAHRHKRTLLLAVYVCMYVCMYIKGKFTHKSVAVFIYFMEHVVPLFAAEVNTQLTHEVFELDTTKTERS